MSKERIDDIKEAYEMNKYDENYGLGMKDIEWLIEQAELMQRFAKKNAELNEFLNEYSEVEHWGQNVIDVAMDIITKQDKQIEVLKDDKVELYKLNAKFGVKAWDIAQENNRYHEILEFYGNKDNYMKYVGMQPITPTIEIDSGKKAREVINND